jgi:hypothetical protein
VPDVRRLSSPEPRHTASRPGLTPLWRLGAAAVVFVLALLASPTHAAPVYTASVSGSCGGGTSTGSTHQIAVVGQIQCPPGLWFYGNAAAQAGSAGIGASADATSFCCGSSSSFGASAQTLTEMMIIGPAGSGPIEVSLNLALGASFSGSVVPGYSDRNLYYSVGMRAPGYGYLFTGSYREVASGLQGKTFTYSGNIPQQIYGVVQGGVLHLDGITTTDDFELPVNTPIVLDLFLNAWVTNIWDAVGAVGAYDTLYFPLGGPVFNLPLGYSAAIYGLNVIDNRVGGGGGSRVPEPGPLVLAVAGLLALGLTWPRRRRAACT